jgi:hypothetical protein
MMDSRGRLKLPGVSHPKRRQVCTLRQDELEIEKLQYLSIILDDSTLLPELRSNVQIYDVNMSSLIATATRDKGGIDAATLAKNWGIGELGLNPPRGRAS